MRSINAHPFGGRAIFCLALLFLSGCAAPRPAVPPVERFDQAQIERALSSIRDTQQRVRAFFCTGTLLVRENDGESSLRILTLGTRKPFRLRVEVSHPWGGPLFHMLLGESTQGLISFSEKKYYTWKGGLEKVPRFFPGPIPVRHLWGLLQGLPVLYQGLRADSPAPGKIALRDEHGRVLQVLYLAGPDAPPVALEYPLMGLRVAFSRLGTDAGIPHARQITVRHHPSGRRIRIRITKMVFNGSIPNPVFALRLPPGFQTISLDADESTRH